MSNFFTLLNRKERHFTEPGSEEANEYTIKLDKKGHKVLEKTGTKNVYEEIQSYAEECKIENILARAAAGDVEALNVRQGFYADITNTPKNLAEAQNEILKLKRGFEKLPAEVREKFDNSVENFVMNFGTDQWAKNMGFKEEAPEKMNEVSFNGTKAPEVLTPEVKE